MAKRYSIEDWIIEDFKKSGIKLLNYPQNIEFEEISSLKGTKIRTKLIEKFEK